MLVFDSSRPRHRVSSISKQRFVTDFSLAFPVEHHVMGLPVFETADARPARKFR